MHELRPWMSDPNNISRGKRRAFAASVPQFEEFYENQLEFLLAEHEMAVNELKYESRLEFGTGSKPSESALWKVTKKILIDGLPSQPSNPKTTPRSQQYPRPIPTRRCFREPCDEP